MGAGVSISNRGIAGLTSGSVVGGNAASVGAVGPCVDRFRVSGRSSVRRQAGVITSETPYGLYSTVSHLPLIPGTRLGVYQITAPIGEGGMGQVYRALCPWPSLGYRRHRTNAMPYKGI